MLSAEEFIGVFIQNVKPVMDSIDQCDDSKNSDSSDVKTINEVAADSRIRLACIIEQSCSSLASRMDKDIDKKIKAALREAYDSIIINEAIETAEHYAGILFQMVEIINAINLRDSLIFPNTPEDQKFDAVYSNFVQKARLKKIISENAPWLVWYLCMSQPEDKRFQTLRNDSTFASALSNLTRQPVTNT